MIDIWKWITWNLQVALCMVDILMILILSIHNQEISLFLCPSWFISSMSGNFHCWDLSFIWLNLFLNVLWLLCIGFLSWFLFVSSSLAYRHATSCVWLFVTYNVTDLDFECKQHFVILFRFFHVQCYVVFLFSYLSSFFSLSVNFPVLYQGWWK